MENYKEIIEKLKDDERFIEVVFRQFQKVSMKQRKY
jgi:hypothetical protein